jgi:hypothetical protein
MSTPHPRLRAVVLAFLGACLLAVVPVSVAKAASDDVPAGLRVVDSKGETLAQQTQYTGAVKIKTDPQADCFGAGTGGSGDPVRLEEPNALGLVADGGTASKTLKPLSISDHFDFGIALCGIGRAVAPDTGYWYLKKNHAGTTTGGDQTPVKRGDEILWFLIEDYNDPVPDELSLIAPADASPGEKISVKVVSYADNGERRPAEGAKVAGAAKPTDAEGVTTVTADEDVLELTARRKGSIPSNTKVICTLAPRDCPAGYAAKIGGTPGADRIVASRRAEKIVAGGGDDKIDASRGRNPDAIRCGAGKDVVTLAKGQRNSRIAASCERIVRS